MQAQKLAACLIVDGPDNELLAWLESNCSFMFSRRRLDGAFIGYMQVGAPKQVRFLL